MLRNAGKHFGTNLFTIVKSEGEILEAWTGKDSVRCS
jgi:hypothetical protein